MRSMAPDCARCLLIEIRVVAAVRQSEHIHKAKEKCEPDDKSQRANK